MKIHKNSRSYMYLDLSYWGCLHTQQLTWAWGVGLGWGDCYSTREHALEIVWAKTPDMETKAALCVGETSECLTDLVLGKLEL